MKAVFKLQAFTLANNRPLILVMQLTFQLHYDHKEFAQNISIIIITMYFQRHIHTRIQIAQIVNIFHYKNFVFDFHN